MRADLDTLLPALRARREETRENRTVLPDIREMVRESGVARILQPPAYGGAGGPLRDVVDAVSEVGAACGSTGWAVVQYVVHPFMVAQWPRDAQDEVWGDDPKNLVAGILIQSLGRYERARGGYRVSGRWPFVTGVDTCDWCIVSGYEEGRAGQHESHLHFLIRREEIEILDTWHALGLRGSGTNDVRLQEFFVPAHRALSMEVLRGGESPGGHWRETPLYPASQLSHLRLRHFQRRGRDRAGDGRGIQRDRAQEGLDHGGEGRGDLRLAAYPLSPKRRPPSIVHVNS